MLLYRGQPPMHLHDPLPACSVVCAAAAQEQPNQEGHRCDGCRPRHIVFYGTYHKIASFWYTQIRGR